MFKNIVKPIKVQTQINSFYRNAGYIIKFLNISCLLISFTLHPSKPYKYCKFFVHIIILVLYLSYSILYLLMFVMKNKLEVERSGYILYYAAAGLVQFSFILVSLKWKSLMKTWTKVDIALSKINRNVTLTLKERLQLILLLIFSVGDYLVFIFTIIIRSFSMNRGHFSIQTYLMELSVLNCFWCSVIGQLLHLLAGFSLILANLLLVTYFMLFYKILKEFGNEVSFYCNNDFEYKSFISFNIHIKTKKEILWQELSLTYNKIYLLYLSIDDTLSFITHICIFRNVVLIMRFLVYLLGMINITSMNFSMIVSFIIHFVKNYLIMKYAGSVHQQTQEINNMFYSASSKEYTWQMKSLMWQVSMNKIYFTMGGIFKIHRGTILSLMTTMFTYILVLVQKKSLLSMGKELYHGNSTIFKYNNTF